MKALICFVIACTPFLSFAKSTPGAADPLLGQWITDQKNLIVEVYLRGSEYQAKIVWFEDDNRTPENRLDYKNPDPALRNRRIIGMDVLTGLSYNNDEGRWENGHIYDGTSGKTWSASAHLADEETLVVRGYWGFEIFGKTLRFSRYK